MQCCKYSLIGLDDTLNSSEFMDQYFKKSIKKPPKQKEYPNGKEKSKKKRDYADERDRKRNYD